MQTPQAFPLRDILAAYRAADAPATDDATLLLRAGHAPRLVEGGEDNFKLTTPQDWARARRLLTRYGTGFDTHRLVEGRPLILAGVRVPFARGLLGHSDADVLAHAVMDALLGAAALPDIGHLFPDTDPAYRGADSMELLKNGRRPPARASACGRTPSMRRSSRRRPRLAPYLPPNAGEPCRRVRRRPRARRPQGHDHRGHERRGARAVHLRAGRRLAGVTGRGAADGKAPARRRRWSRPGAGRPIVTEV